MTIYPTESPLQRATRRLLTGAGATREEVDRLRRALQRAGDGEPLRRALIAAGVAPFDRHPGEVALLCEEQVVGDFRWTMDNEA